MSTTPPDSESEDLGFTYHARKSGMVEVLHHGKVATRLGGAEAKDFLAEVVSGTFAEGQQLMARLTGNYKRGNERTAGNHPRNRG